MRSLAPIRIRPGILFALCILPPVVFWVLIASRPHSGFVETLNDYFLLESQKGWQPFLLAVCVGVGPLAAAAVGTLFGVEVSGRPRVSGELSYLRIAGQTTYRTVMLSRGVFAVVATVVFVLLLALCSYLVGIVAFGSGTFATPAGDLLSRSELLTIALRCIASVCCIGIVSCSAAMVIGIRFSVQASVVVGMSLPFLRQAVGSVPGLRSVFEYLPIGNYFAWTNRLIGTQAQGSESILYSTTAACLGVALLLVASARWFVAPRVGST